MKALLETRRMVKYGLGPAFGALALALAAACGSSDPAQGSVVTGVVSSDASSAGTVSLKDSSTPAQERTIAVDDSGAYALEVDGLTPPYLLKAESTGSEPIRLYSVSREGGRANINPITSAAVAGADDAAATEDVDLYERGDPERIRRTVAGFEAVITALQTVLEPLFELYGVPADPFTDDGRAAELRAMLRDVRITVRAGTVVVTNRATSGVIFSGSLRELASGTFDPAQLPPAPGTTPPPTPATCSAFTYSAWGACQPDDTQSRTVTSSSPAGCTGGSPVLSQACTYVPPVTTCSAFTYSAWGACQSNDTQTRTVTSSSPAGCTGGSPVLSQACTYVPPVTTCSAFTYSAWGTCQSDDTQTRTVTSSSPAGCTGGSPVLSQACTYVPPACTYTYSAWGTCSTSGTQSRTVVSSSPAGCAGTPVLSQTCTPPPPTASCTTCHGIPPATGKHSFHQSFASCGTCHGSGYSTTTADPATHMNGVKNLAATTGWNATSRTCANSCHGSKSW
jgi:hypothetical protein